MRKRTIIAACFISLFIQNVAFGRLGETIEKCMERYGRVEREFVEGPFTVVVLINEKFLTDIRLYDGICKRIQYTDNAFDFDFTKEINLAYELVEKNSEGYKWEEKTNDRDARIRICGQGSSDARCWQRSDGATACFRGGYLYIVSRDYYELRKMGVEKEKKQAEEALKQSTEKF